MAQPTRLVPRLVGRNPLPFLAQVPGSKSYTARALVLAAMRSGTTVVDHGNVCDDTLRLARALDAFGGLRVEQVERGFRVTRVGTRLEAPRAECDMGGAGTAARLLMAFATLANGSTVVTGNERLCERPMGDLIQALTALGVRIECLRAKDRLPVRIHGGPITARTWSIAGGTSSQFVTALLLLASQQPGGTVRIEVTGEQVSRPYVDMTLALLQKVGIRARREGAAAFVVDPGQPTCDVIAVEPDASAMSNFLAAAAITETTVEISGIDQTSAQGDLGFAFALGRMGCKVAASGGRVRLTGGRLQGIELDMDAMPDMVLSLAVVAPFASGPTRIKNIARLRLKESDRLHAAATELARLGVRVEQGPDWLRIHPTRSFQPARIETYADHRVAMAFAVLGLGAGGVEIQNPECVEKSFPSFWQELERLAAHHAKANPAQPLGSENWIH